MWSPLIGQRYLNMGLNKCMNKALQQWCSWLRINGRHHSDRWIQGFSMCVTRTGKEGESHTFPSCDWGSCAWWWAFNCPCHSSWLGCDPLIGAARFSFQTRPEVAPSPHRFGKEVVNSPALGMTSASHHTPSLCCTVWWAWPPGPESQPATSDCDLLPVLLSFLQRRFARMLRKIIKRWNKDDSWSSVVMSAPFKQNPWLRGGASAAQIRLWCHW